MEWHWKPKESCRRTMCAQKRKSTTDLIFGKRAETEKRLRKTGVMKQS
jgi:hypothetical protein